ncbi:Ig-like domain-containing protein [Streptomyces sp. NPDC088337]|uniref:L,D-transpeptidase n=1 Tax=unclassified Streptomyces TaxID=2593676 RepID=UPI00380E2B54
MGALALTSCSDASENHAKNPAHASPAAVPARAEVEISAKNGSTGASINATRVVSRNATLTKVSMTRADTGDAVEGETSSDGKTWKPSAQLERGARYEITAEGKSSTGNTVVEHFAFTTVTTKDSFIGTFTPDGGATVGVGMPVSFNFDKAITDKEAVLSHITVTSSSGQEVSGHWFGERRLDFRPKEYWEPGSTVTMKLDLDGVEGASGIHVVQSKTVKFTVGRSQVSLVDMNTQTMTVMRDGKVFRKIPISGGSPQNPTYNGQMVISEKFKKTHMDSSTVGFGGDYNLTDVPHAMRLSTSGTFVHGNYWGDPSSFGSIGTSHGCIGLRDVQGGGSDTPAKWFYDHSLVGDVIIVKNSPDSEKSIQPDNGLNGWNMNWETWTGGSAA